jgi:hypothetical protein
VSETACGADGTMQEEITGSRVNNNFLLVS